jgi:hypothetical protein
MKIDLCKLFGVEEGEEFKFENCEWAENTRYVIQDNYLMVVDFDNSTYKSCIELNDLVGSEIIKLPKKKQFTADELCILRNIDKEYKWIARDEEDGGICVFIEKPLRKEHLWDFKRSSQYIEFHCYNHLFNSITWEDEEPVFIDDYVERGAENE